MMMKSTAIDLIQILTGVAVLAGLVLVIIELRQSHSLSRAEVTAMTYSDFSANEQSQLSENFADTFVKACTDPLKLSDAEMHEMIAFGNLQLITMTRFRLLQEIAGYDYDWRVSSRGPVRRWLSTPVGVATYYEVKDHLHPELIPVIEARIKEIDVAEHCKTQLSNTRNTLIEIVGDK